MNEFVTWALMVGLMLLSTMTGHCLTRAFPWRDELMYRRLRWPLASLLGPFLLGLVSVVVLVLMEGLDSRIHLLSIVLALTLSCLALGIGSRTRRFSQVTPRGHMSALEWLLVGVLLLCVINFLFLALRLPLTENDALEYGMVGRSIYERRGLSAYPLIDPDWSASGFFAPWTHPPLYTSLIYLSYVLQGNATSALVMKALAPWFVLTATWTVIGMGRLRGNLAGLLAGLLFLTTPLLTAGGETAAIDALPIAGMLLMMLAVISMDRKRASAPLYAGLLLGIALWTHSQAILYPPIFVGLILVTGGKFQLRQSLAFSFKSLLVAGLIAGYPYARNVAIYGSLISDNPAVFALPSLDWEGYFKGARSIYDWSTRLQYGLFKGLLVWHSYGLVFIMGGLTCGYLFFTGAIFKWLRMVYRQPAQIEAQDWAVIIPLCVILIYYGGILASIAIGSDLMIKNDRYLLVLVPGVALLAAFGLSDWLLKSEASAEKNDPSRRRRIGIRLWLAVVVLGHGGAFVLYANVFQWLTLLDVKLPLPSTQEYVMAHIRSAKSKLLPQNEKLTVDASSESSSADSALAREQLANAAMVAELQPPSVAFRTDPFALWPGIKLVQQLDQEIAPGVKVLAVRPAYMYYTQRRMVSYLDPQMVDAYNEPDAPAFAAILRRQNIGYVQVPNYFIPPVPNSALMKLIAAPDQTELVHDYGFFQLYRLRDLPATAASIDLSRIHDLGRLTWSEYPKFGVSAPSFSFTYWTKEVKMLPYTAESQSPFLPKSYSHRLEVGRDRSSTEGQEVRIPVQAGKEYLIRLDVEGEGFMRVWVTKLSKRNRDALLAERDDLAGDFVLSKKVTQLQFERRMRIEEGVSGVRISIERYGVSRLTLKNALLIELDKEVSQ